MNRAAGVTAVRPRFPAAHLADHHTLTAAAARSWDELDEFIYRQNVYDDHWNLVDVIENDYSGNPIALFPDHQVTLGLRSAWNGWDTSLRLRRVGRQHLDNSGIAKRTLDPYTVVDVGASLALGRLGGPALTGARLELRVRNLLDEKYETSGYYDDVWGAGNYKIPAAERNFLVGVKYVF